MSFLQSLTPMQILGVGIALLGVGSFAVEYAPKLAGKINLPSWPSSKPSRSSAVAAVETLAAFAKESGDHALAAKAAECWTCLAPGCEGGEK